MAFLMTIIACIGLLLVDIGLFYFGTRRIHREALLPIISDPATIIELKHVDQEYSPVMEIIMDTKDEGVLTFFADEQDITELEIGEHGILKHQGHTFLDFVETSH